jgi:Bacterial toxin homologue of phage lysozyme, C-term
MDLGEGGSMPDKIDYKFISALEGSRITKAYVPAPTVSRSGITVGTGFDLGQRNENDLKNLNISAGLRDKLKQYVGRTGRDAEDYLVKHPLTISDSEADEIDKAVHGSHIAQLKQKYICAADNKVKRDLFDLPAEAQTVIASVSFQYGVNVDTATPKFWKAVTAQDWPEALKILKDFGDVYPIRRRKEAELLNKVVPAEKAPEKGQGDKK